MLDLEAKAKPVQFVTINGVEISVITNGYGSEHGLYEALVTDVNDQPVIDLIPGGDDLGLYGWLDANQLGLLIEKAVRLYDD